MERLYLLEGQGLKAHCQWSPWYVGIAAASYTPLPRHSDYEIFGGGRKEAEVSLTCSPESKSPAWDYVFAPPSTLPASGRTQTYVALSPP